MGFWNQLKKSTGFGKNGDTGRIGLGLFTGGGSEIANALSGGKIYSGKSNSNLTDIFMGKKQKDINPDAIADQIRDTQTKGIGELNAALDTPSENIVREQAARASKGVLTSAQDARRNAQSLMARTGLKGSSLGLASNRSIDQASGRDMASINAALPGQIRNQQIQDATTRIGVGGVNQGGMNFNKIEGQRTGGLMGIASALAPIAGSIAGGMAGGPAGAAAGGQMGQGIGSALKSQQGQGAYNPNKYSMGNYQL